MVFYKTRFSFWSWAQKYSKNFWWFWNEVNSTNQKRSFSIPDFWFIALGEFGLRVVITVFFLDVEVNPLNEIEIWKNAFKYKYSSWSKSRLLEFLSWHTACPGNCSSKISKIQNFQKILQILPFLFFSDSGDVHFRIIYRMEKGICRR